MPLSFENICDQEFGYLLESGFRKLNAEKRSVVYGNDSTFVSVSMDRDQTLHVFVGRNDHHIPEGLESYAYDITDVVHERQQQHRWHTTRDDESDWPALTERARLLRSFASDVLRGDFDVFRDAQRQVDKRSAAYFRRLKEE